SHSPMSTVALYYEANVKIDQNDLQTALSGLRAIGKAARKRYPALRAEIAWTTGVVLGRLGRWNESLEQLSFSESLFGRLNEHANAAQAADNIASVLTSVGRVEESWRKRRDTITALGTAGDLRAQDKALDAAAAGEFIAHRWNSA